MSDPVAFDPEAPSSARICDCLLGGDAYLPSDRKLAAELEQICPGIREIALSGREFLARAVTWAATQGITQFIDLGCGAPVAAEWQRASNLRSYRRDADVHAVARDVNPAATVAYVDHDRVIAGTASGLLEPAGPGIAVVTADLRDPGTVLEDKGLQEVIDPGRPLCVILGLVLNLMSARKAREVVAGYIRAAAPGSCVVISTGRCDAPALFARIQEACTPARLHNHTRAQVASFFAGLDLIRPGVKPAAGLRPGWGDAPETADRAYVLGGIGVRT